MIKRLPSDIIYLQLTTESPDNFRKELRENGFNINSCFKYPDLAKKIEELNFATIIISCGNIEEIASDIADKLIKSSNFLAYPIIILSKNPEGISKKLKSESLLIKTLEADSSAKIIAKELKIFNSNFEAYSEVLNSEYPEIYKKLQLKSAPTKIVKSTPIISREKQEENAKILLDNFSSINAANHLNSDSFQQSVRVDDLKAEGFFPENPVHQKYVSDIYEKLENREVYIVNRDIYINGKTCRLLAFDKQNLNQSISASYICVGELISNKDLMQKNFYLDKTGNLRQEASTLIKKALDNQLIIAPENIAKIIDKTASILDKSTNASGDDVSLIASTILCGKVINSSCFKSGFWNLSGAHWLISSIRRGEFDNYHPEAVAGMLAFASRGLDCEYGFDSKLESYKRNNIIYIPLSQMKNGMKLASNIKSKSGNTIIESDTFLDNDLILRIIQFSAIEPIEIMGVYVDPLK